MPGTTKVENPEQAYSALDEASDKLMSILESMRTVIPAMHKKLNANREANHNPTAEFTAEHEGLSKSIENFKDDLITKIFQCLAPITTMMSELQNSGMTTSLVHESNLKKSFAKDVESLTNEWNITSAMYTNKIDAEEKLIMASQARPASVLKKK